MAALGPQHDLGRVSCMKQTYPQALAWGSHGPEADVGLTSESANWRGRYPAFGFRLWQL